MLAVAAYIVIGSAYIAFPAVGVVVYKTLRGTWKN